MRPIFAVVGAVVALAGSVAAQTVVTGTGDPNVDVPAVQAAVDQGGHVVLTGNFSFDRPPTAPAGATYNRMVTVSQNTVISGAPDGQGGMPTIMAGNWPFFIDAAGANVTIERLHFVGSKAGAIWVYAVGGLLVAGCRIEGPSATAEFGVQGGVTSPVAGGIFVGADAHPPSANFPGQPGNFTGKLSIVNNDIDMGATSGALYLGIVLFSVGTTDQPVDVTVSANRVTNVTEPAINFREIGGRVLSERNTITTGAVTGGAANPDAYRVVGSGSYLIARNSIDCGWPDPNATGINLFGQSATLPPVADAVVVDNAVTMSAPDGTAFTTNSAAIELNGLAHGNIVLHNKIHGRAGAALAVVTRSNTVSPSNNMLVSNDFKDFQSSSASIFLDAGVTNTVIVGGPASLLDHASGTVVVPLP